MKRIEGWPEALYAVIDASSEMPFEYGRHDCCLFAAACIDAMCATHFTRELAGEWRDEDSAAEFIAAHGTIIDAVSAVLMIEPRVGWQHARRGDLCLVPTERGPGAGVCIGAQIAVAGGVGVDYYPLTEATHVWRIGDA